MQIIPNLSLDKIVCGPKINEFEQYPQHVPLVSIEAMFGLVRIFVDVPCSVVLLPAELADGESRLTSAAGNIQTPEFPS
jgi:hypothetical protein